MVILTSPQDIISDIAVTAVPQNNDNYSYVVICGSTNDCVVIDVGDAQPILQCLKDKHKIPHAVLVTHKHWFGLFLIWLNLREILGVCKYVNKVFHSFAYRDHCYGNRELKKRYKELNIYGGEIDRPADVNM